MTPEMAARPSSAEKKDRPGSAGRNRGNEIKHSVWLTDKKKLDRSSIKDAEAKVDKDIFKKGSPKKKGAKKEEKKKKVTQEDPGPLRPTTAKRRGDRPSSAERNRDDKVKPSVWLENVSRDSKAGNRSFINCDPVDKKAEPQSAGKTKKKKSRTNIPDRPSSAEGKRKVPQKTDNNGQILDQNGRPQNLAPLRGLTPLKPIIRPGGAAEV